MAKAKRVSDSKIEAAVTGFLKHFPFFQSLDKEELGAISQYIDFLEVEEEVILFKEGDDGNSVYFVVDGEIDVLKETVSGPRVGISKVAVATLSKGSTIGELSLIDNTPRSATVETHTNSTLVRLTRDGFESILDEHPRIGIKIFRGLTQLLSKNLRKTTGRLADYTIAQERL
jgi:CRP-like cAMP-binding protein